MHAEKDNVLYVSPIDIPNIKLCLLETWNDAEYKKRKIKVNIIYTIITVQYVRWVKIREERQINLKIRKSKRKKEIKKYRQNYDIERKTNEEQAICSIKRL
jgi:hypothetical protein